MTCSIPLGHFFPLFAVPSLYSPHLSHGSTLARPLLSALRCEREQPPGAATSRVLKCEISDCFVGQKLRAEPVRISPRPENRVVTKRPPRHRRGRQERERAQFPKVVGTHVLFVQLAQHGHLGLPPTGASPVSHVLCCSPKLDGRAKKHASRRAKHWSAGFATLCSLGSL
jgi:hypothetical protein